MAEEEPTPLTEQELSELPEEIDRTQEKEEEDDDGDTEDLPPLRMHATKGHVQRLSASKIIMPEDLQKSLASEDRRSARRRLGKGDAGLPRSRSRSPSVKNTETTVDGGSSISSLDDVADYMGIDVLLDKAGFEELDPQTSSISVKELTESFRALPPVTERLTNDDLEDIHAFSDVQPPARSGASGDNSIATGGDVASASNFMETLDECDNEENEEEDMIDPNRPEVILENLENLELDEKEGGEGAAAEGSAPPRGDESGQTE